MLKENVVVVKTVEDEEGALGFQTACQTTTSPPRVGGWGGNTTEGSRDSVPETVQPALIDEGEPALYQRLRGDAAPATK